MLWAAVWMCRAGQGASYCTDAVNGWSTASGMGFATAAGMDWDNVFNAACVMMLGMPDKLPAATLADVRRRMDANLNKWHVSHGINMRVLFLVVYYKVDQFQRSWDLLRMTIVCGPCSMLLRDLNGALCPERVLFTLLPSPFCNLHDTCAALPPASGVQVSTKCTQPPPGTDWNGDGVVDDWTICYSGKVGVPYGTTVRKS